MSASVPTLAGFLDRIRPFQDLWTSIEFRYSAVKQQDRWCNLFSRVQFRWDPLACEVHELEIETETFRGGCLRLPLKAGLEWLKGVETGSVRVGGTQINLGHEVRRPGSDVDSFTHYSWSIWKLDRYGGLRNLPSRSPEWEQGFEFAGYGEWANTLLNIDGWGATHDALLASRKPYAGLAEFTVGFLGFTEARSPIHPVVLEVEAFYGALFDEWAIKEGKFVGSVQRPRSSRLGDLSITAILSSPDSPLRLHLPLRNERDVEGTPLVASDFSFPFEGFQLVELHLLLRGHDVDALQIRFPSPDTPNPRLRALEALDLMWKNLNTTLDEAGAVKNPAALEMLVSWVLHLCGFQVMLVGHPPLHGGDVPDLLAFDPFSNEGLVVEVTRDVSLSQDKMIRLSKRTASVQYASPSVRFHAVAVAPAAESFLESEIKAARELGVALLSKQDLTQLLNEAQENPLPTDVLRKVFLTSTNQR
ncbi:MAG TPA: hypothetical protein VGG32_00105 [Thermoplasmata archaeon]|jgi:hypothetical protein